MMGNSNSGKLLIFDFDQTITNQHMHNHFSRICHRSDYNSGKDNAVTEEDIGKFLKDKDSGIKNAEKLKSVLQNAFDTGVEVAIASFTSYPKAVEYVVQNYLGLTEEQAKNIKVVGGLPDSTIRTKHGKNLHILYLLKKYKSEHKGQLPQEVMLVDDDVDNVNCINGFHENIGALLAQEKNISGILKNIEEGIEGTEITAEELKKIEFTGVQVPGRQIKEISEADKKKPHYNYLNKVEEWIGAHCAYHEELKGSIDDKVEERRKLRFNEKVKVQTVEASTKTDNVVENSSNQKPQPWKKCAAIIAPPMIGAIIGGLTFLVLTAVGVGSPFLIAAALVALVTTTVAAYAIEQRYLKPELEPLTILKELAKVIKNSVPRVENGSAQ